MNNIYTGIEEYYKYNPEINQIVYGQKVRNAKQMVGVVVQPKLKRVFKKSKRLPFLSFRGKYHHLYAIKTALGIDNIVLEWEKHNPENTYTPKKPDIDSWLG